MRLSSRICLLAGLAVAVAPARLPAQRGMGAGLGRNPLMPAFSPQSDWPKPLPNRWSIGAVSAIAVDSRDHIWVLHHPPDGTPPVLEFDAGGALVGQWGGPGSGYDWPNAPGGMAVDALGNVWVTAAGPANGREIPGREDAHVLKFSRDGKFLLQVGKPGEIGDRDSETRLDHPSAIAVDAREVYIADGRARQRIVVFDAATGAHTRHWHIGDVRLSRTNTLASEGLARPLADFAGLSAIALGRDGRVHLADRVNDDLYVFSRDGADFSRPGALTGRSPWAMSLSTDPEQGFMYVADGKIGAVWILDHHGEALPVVGSLVPGGGADSLRAVGSIALDSSGSVYTGSRERPGVLRWKKNVG